MMQSPLKMRTTLQDFIARSLLVMGIAALCLTHLGSYRPLTHHEVYVAQTAREMWQSGNWLLPTYFGEPRYQKPPLAYWQTLASYNLFGVANDWTARLPAALTGIVLALLVAVMAGKRYGSQVGWIAGIVQATSVYFLIQARLAEADITVAFAVTAALFSYAAIADRVRTRRLIKEGQDSIPIVSLGSCPVALRGLDWGFWLSLVLAALAKGPVGPVLVVSVVFVHCLIGRRWWAIKQLCRPGPMLAACLLISAWPVAILWQDPAAGQIWLRESAGRFLRDPNDVVRHSFYYPLAALWLTLPWTPFWLFGFARSLKTCRWFPSLEADEMQGTNSFEQLLGIWLLVPMGLLSLSAGKQEHYLIPALIPCSFLTAIGVNALINRFRQQAPARWWEVGGWLVMTDRRLAATATCLVLSIVTVEMWVLPVMHGRRTYADFARSELIPSQSPTILLGHSVQWLVFYAPGETVRCDSLEEFFRNYGEQGGSVIATQADAEAIAAHLPVLSRQFAPWDGNSSKRKQPILLQFGPIKGGLAN